MAGTISHTANSKRYRAAELALRDRVPLVMMLDGAGFRADGKAYGRAPTDLLSQSRCSGHVPLITAVLGSSAGHGALVAPMSDFSVMSAHAAIFTAGPPVVLESLGETVTKEELGGPGVAIAERADPQRRARRRRRARAGAPLPELLPVVGVVVPARLRARRHRAAPRRRRSSTSCRATASASTTCATSSTSSSTSRRGSRCSPTSASRWSPRSRTSAATRSRSSPTSPRCARARSTSTAPTRRRTSSPSPTRSTCRSSSSPTTRACCPAPRRSGAASCAPARACSRRRRWRRHPKFEVTLRKAYGFGSMVMGMIGFDNQSAVFALPGATMGAMGAAAMSRSRGSDVDEAELLKKMELEASYRSAQGVRLRRAHRPARDPQRAAALARARAVPAAGRRPSRSARVAITP